MAKKTKQETRKEWVQDLLAKQPAVEQAIGAPLGKMLGCGYFGCVFDSTDPWVVKLTVDPQEGPMWAVIMELIEKEGGLGQAGFTRIKEIVRLKPGAGRGKRKKALYAIVREAVHPVFESAPPNVITDYTLRRLELDPDDKFIDPDTIVNQVPDLDRLFSELVETRGISHAEADRITEQLQDFWNVVRAAYVYDDAVSRYHRRKLTRKGMLAQITKVLKLCKGDVGRGMGEALTVLKKHDVFLQDLHVLNIGWRTFADVPGMIPQPQGVVMFDPGYTPTPYRPKIQERMVRNAPSWTKPSPVFR
jgi:hypothetical protein